MVYSAKLHVTKTGLYKLVSQQYDKFPKMKETDFISGRGKRTGWLYFYVDDVSYGAHIAIRYGGVVLVVNKIQYSEERVLWKELDIALLKELRMVKGVTYSDN